MAIYGDALGRRFRYPALSALEGGSLPLTVKWAGGVTVECGDTRVIFDPQVSNPLYPNVFITHAHYDHARGLGFPDSIKFSTRETRDLVEAVKGGRIYNWKPVQYGRKVEIGDLEIEPRNAGHILGSALYEVTSPEGSLVYTGDLNFVDMLTTRAAEASPCDILVVEATFGSRDFTFPPEERISAEIVQWAVNSIKGARTPAFQTDSMGNAQELIRVFNTLTTIPVVTHERVTRVNRVYESYGHLLDYVEAGSEAAGAPSPKRVFIAPKHLNIREGSGFDVAYVSGWASRLGGGRRPFPLSDHADFNQLLRFVEESRPRLVLTCHGRRFDALFARHVNRELGIEARPLSLVPTTAAFRQG